MDKEMMEQFQMIITGMGQMEERINKKVEGVHTELKAEIAGVRTELKRDIKDSETRMKVYIENEVSSKIGALFDGYKSALENQALLEITNKTLADKLEHMEMRITALENKTA